MTTRADTPVKQTTKPEAASGKVKYPQVVEKIVPRVEPTPELPEIPVVETPPRPADVVDVLARPSEPAQVEPRLPVQQVALESEPLRELVPIDVVQVETFAGADVKPIAEVVRAEPLRIDEFYKIPPAEAEVIITPTETALELPATELEVAPEMAIDMAIPDQETELAIMPDVGLVKDAGDIFEADLPVQTESTNVTAGDTENTPEARTAREIVTRETLEATFEPETIDTYLQIAALSAVSEKSEAMPVGITAEQLDGLDDPVLPAPITMSNSFETFLAARPSPESTVTLETLRELADERPVEDSLTLLVEYLAEPPVATPEQAALREIVREIELALPACFVEQEGEQEDAPPIVRVTPEMTDNLLKLLRVMGYQNPGDSLVRTVSDSGSPFLIDALSYICEMTGDDRRDLFKASATDPIDEDSKLRFGRILIGLLAGRSARQSHSEWGAPVGAYAI